MANKQIILLYTPDSLTILFQGEVNNDVREMIIQHQLFQQNSCDNSHHKAHRQIISLITILI